MTQEWFNFGLLDRAREKWTHVRSITKEVVDGLGEKYVADELGYKHLGTFSNAMSDQNRCHLKPWEFVAIILRDDGDRVLRFLAAMKGYELKPVISDSELLRRYVEATRRKAGPLADEIMDEVMGARR